MRGRKPSCTACLVIENAPEITACDAMMVAAVASSTSGTSAQPGADSKNGCSTAAGFASTSARLTEVVQHQTRQHEQQPRETNRLLAEVAHVRVKRFAAGQREKHRTQHDESGAGRVGDETHGIERRYGLDDGRTASRYAAGPAPPA